MSLVTSQLQSWFGCWGILCSVIKFFAQTSVFQALGVISMFIVPSLCLFRPDTIDKWRLFRRSNTDHWPVFFPKFSVNVIQHSIKTFAHGIRAPSQYPKRRLFVRSRKVSKPRDLDLDLSDRSEIWQALRKQCCRCACQISKRYDNLKYRSRGFETSRDLTKRRLFGYWDGAQVVTPCLLPQIRKLIHI